MNLSSNIFFRLVYFIVKTCECLNFLSRVTANMVCFQKMFEISIQRFNKGECRQRSPNVHKIFYLNESKSTIFRSADHKQTLSSRRNSCLLLLRKQCYT